MYSVSFMLGALVMTFLISRLARATVFRKARGPNRAIGAGLLTVAVATVLGGFGAADGGAPKFATSLLQYLVPTLVWVGYDLWRDRRSERAPESSSQAV